jgi:hypothetical protein
MILNEMDDEAPFINRGSSSHSNLLLLLATSLRIKFC